MGGTPNIAADVAKMTGNQRSVKKPKTYTNQKGVFKRAIWGLDLEIKCYFDLASYVPQIARRKIKIGFNIS